MREVEAAAVILEKDYGVAADIWSMTSVNELARDGHKVSRRNMMNPAESRRCLTSRSASRRRGSHHRCD